MNHSPRLLVVSLLIVGCGGATSASRNDDGGAASGGALTSAGGSAPAAGSAATAGGAVGSGGAGGSGNVVTGSGGRPCFPPPSVDNDPRCPASFVRYGNGPVPPEEADCSTPGLECARWQDTSWNYCEQPPRVVIYICCGGKWSDGECPRDAGEPDGAVHEDASTGDGGEDAGDTGIGAG